MKKKRKKKIKGVRYEGRLSRRRSVRVWLCKVTHLPREHDYTAYTHTERETENHYLPLPYIPPQPPLPLHTITTSLYSRTLPKTHG